MAECVRLDTQLHQGQGGYTLDESVLQRRLDEISSAAYVHDMKLNLAKTKIIPFNFTRKHQFEPNFILEKSILLIMSRSMFDIYAKMSSIFSGLSRARNLNSG